MAYFDDKWLRLALVIHEVPTIAVKPVLDKAISTLYDHLFRKSFEEKLEIALQMNMPHLKKFLLPYEYLAVFPTSMCPGRYEVFDIVIITKLVQYFVGKADWDKDTAALPDIAKLHDSDLAHASEVALVKVLKDYRNFIFHHLPYPPLTDIEFSRHWDNLLLILDRLGYDVTDLHCYKSGPLDYNSSLLVESLKKIESTDVSPSGAKLVPNENMAYFINLVRQHAEKLGGDITDLKNRMSVLEMSSAPKVLQNYQRELPSEDEVNDIQTISSDNPDRVEDSSVMGCNLTCMKPIKKIGSGAFGDVFLCEDEKTGTQIAKKVVKIGPLSEEAKKNLEVLQEEIRLFKKLTHHRIIKYYDSFINVATISIIMEYMPGGSISKKISEHGALTEDECRKYCMQMLEGLVYLHGEKVIHRDIKGANILLDAQDDCKLADFGASREFTQTYSVKADVKSTHGTCYWMSPELVRGEPYGRNTDVWSFGCTIVEMLTTKPPWAQYEPCAAIFKIGNGDSVPLDLPSISSDCKQMIESCFVRNPNSRPSASDLLRHPFVCVDMKP